MNRELGLLVKCVDTVDKSHGAGVSVLASQEGPGFADDQVRGDSVVLILFGGVIALRPAESLRNAYRI